MCHVSYLKNIFGKRVSLEIVSNNIYYISSALAVDINVKYYPIDNPSLIYSKDRVTSLALTCLVGIYS